MCNCSCGINVLQRMFKMVLEEEVETINAVKLMSKVNKISLKRREWWQKHPEKRVENGERMRKWYEEHPEARVQRARACLRRFGRL